MPRAKPTPNVTDEHESIFTGEPIDDEPKDKATSINPSQKLLQMKAKLALLKTARVESKASNRKDVHKEFIVSKENPKAALKLEQKRKEAQDLLDKQTALKNGVDIERETNLSYTVDDVERWNSKMEAKHERMNRGFTDYAQVSAKQYNRLVSELKPNLGKYAQQASASTSGDNSDLKTVYRGAHSLAYANPDSKPTPESLDRLRDDVLKQDERRKTFSRRRAYNEDEDVTGINEKNMQFNKKIARAFDKYTADIKQSFERGTAL